LSKDRKAQGTIQMGRMGRTANCHAPPRYVVCVSYGLDLRFAEMPLLDLGQLCRTDTKTI
jgi:hypothetical protein